MLVLARVAVARVTSSAMKIVFLILLILVSSNGVSPKTLLQTLCQLVPARMNPLRVPSIQRNCWRNQENWVRLMNQGRTFPVQAYDFGSVLDKEIATRSQPSGRGCEGLYVGKRASAGEVQPFWDAPQVPWACPMVLHVRS